MITTAGVNLLCRLPVQLARRWVRRSAGTLPLHDASRGEQQLLVDVSTIIKHDDRTGIQRVVRALFLELLAHTPAGWRVRPVYATRTQGYHYAPDHFGRPQFQAADQSGTAAVRVASGDLFLALDLAAHILPRHQVELARWKRRGVKIHIMVYDLLPVLHPDWFNKKNTNNIRRWLRSIAIFADSCICISKTVKRDLEEWLLNTYSLKPGSVLVNVLPLGANIEASAPSRGLPANSDQLVSAIFSKTAVLVVGTLEPRKGHDQILASFEELWRQERNVNLVIVGKPGWKTEALQKALNTHPERNVRLFWLSDASDELLEILYARSAGVIVASKAEGFGLSLIEAMFHQKPVFARDITTFREIAGNAVTFFSSGDGLVKELEAWLADIEQGQHRPGQPQLTWEKSASVLFQYLGFQRPATAKDLRATSRGVVPQNTRTGSLKASIVK